MDGCCEFGKHRSRVLGGANHEEKGSSRILIGGEIYRWANRLIQPPLTEIADHADDPVERALCEGLVADQLTDRIFPGKELPRHSLVDHCYGGMCGIIGFSEETPG